MSQVPDQSFPTVIGKYRILADIGRGGMANVFLAVAQGLSGFNKLVVLKMIRAHLVEDQDTLQMFLEEARLAGRLNHPNVVHTLEVVEEDGRTVMVMEYLEGQPLGAIQRRTTTESIAFPLPLKLRTVLEALQGLQYAHEVKGFDGSPLNVVHRDVSPQNIFVTYDGQIKVLDFGIAKVVTSSIETKVGVVKGKLAYMPPEQLLGEEIDRRADLFAMGAVLWHLGTGRRLWKGVPDVQLIGRLMRGDIPAPSTIAPDIDPELERITMKALAFRPDDRYSTAMELHDDIDAMMQAKGWKASAREVGAFTAEVFDDLRTQITQTIESQLSKARNLTADGKASASAAAVIKLPGLQASNPDGRFTAETTSGVLDSNPALQSGVSQVGEPGRRSRARWLLVGAFGLGVCVTGAFLLLPAMGTKAPPEAAPSANLAAAAGSAVEPPVPTVAVVTASSAADDKRDFVEIAIQARPGSARIYVDDQEQAANPATKRLPRGTTSHKIRAEATGFQSQVVEVRADRDASVTLALEWSGGGGAAAARHGDKGKPEATVAAPPPATTHAPPPATTPPATTPTGDGARDRIKSLDKSNPWAE